MSDITVNNYVQLNQFIDTCGGTQLREIVFALPQKQLRVLLQCFLAFCLEHRGTPCSIFKKALSSKLIETIHKTASPAFRPASLSLSLDVLQKGPASKSCQIFMYTDITCYLFRFFERKERAKCRGISRSFFEICHSPDTIYCVEVFVPISTAESDAGYVFLENGKEREDMSNVRIIHAVSREISNPQNFRKELLSDILSKSKYVEELHFDRGASRVFAERFQSASTDTSLTNLQQFTLWTNVSKQRCENSTVDTAVEVLRTYTRTSELEFVGEIQTTSSEFVQKENGNRHMVVVPNVLLDGDENYEPDFLQILPLKGARHLEIKSGDSHLWYKLGNSSAPQTILLERLSQYIDPCPIKTVEIHRWEQIGLPSFPVMQLGHIRSLILRSIKFNEMHYHKRAYESAPRYWNLLNGLRTTFVQSIDISFTINFSSLLAFETMADTLSKEIENMRQVAVKIFVHSQFKEFRKGQILNKCYDYQCYAEQERTHQVLQRCLLKILQGLSLKCSTFSFYGDYREWEHSDCRPKVFERHARLPDLSEEVSSKIVSMISRLTVDSSANRKRSEEFGGLKEISIRVEKCHLWSISSKEFLEFWFSDGLVEFDGLYWSKACRMWKRSWTVEDVKAWYRRQVSMSKPQYQDV